MARLAVICKSVLKKTQNKCDTAVPNFTSFLTYSVMGRMGKENHHQLPIKHLTLTKLSESSGVKQVYRQLKFEYGCLNRCQVMGKVHVIFDTPSTEIL